MSTICLNLLEATVSLYPTNPDGSPQLQAPIWLGAPAETLKGVERWVKKETMPSGARYPKKHLLVSQYEVAIGRVWILPEVTPMDWQTDYPEYVLDILWVEGETREWHRKTFYGVTVNERSWDAKDIENGLVENQMFDARYLVSAGGSSNDPVPPVPATLPYRVVYTDATSSVLLYTYADGSFTAVADTTGRATITNNPTLIRFAAGDVPLSVLGGDPPLAYRSPSTYRNSKAYSSSSALTYRSPGSYRNSNFYQRGDFRSLVLAGIYAEPASPAEMPRLDFYHGLERVFTATPGGIYDINFVEGAPGVPADGDFGIYAPGPALVAVFSSGGLTAQQIRVAT